MVNGHSGVDHACFSVPRSTAVTIPPWMKAVHSQTIDAGRFIIRRFPLAQIEEAYATFAAAAASGAIKVVIEASD